MRRYQRRAIYLMHVVSLLPLIAATMTVGFQICNGIERFQRRMNRQMIDQTRMNDLARRIQLDAQAAETASAGPTETGATLRFPGVIYEATEHRVVRTERAAGRPDVSYTWPFDEMDVRFTIESTAGKPRLVWMTFAAQWPAERGPPLERRCCVAAKLGRGGAG